MSQQAVVAAESKKFSISLPSGISIADGAAAAARSLTLADRARVQSSTGTLLSIANSGTSSGGSTELGVEAQSGSILSAPPVTLRDRSRVEGNVQSGGAVTRQNQTVVTGTVTANSAPSFDRWSWTVNFPAASQSVAVPVNGSTTINPGAFENVTVFPGGTLRLNTGTYYLKSLDLEPQAQLLIDTTQGPVFLYVRSGLTWRGATNFTGPSDRLLVGYAGADSFAIESPFSGTLVAPDATVRLAVGATSHLGAFFAKNLQLDPDVRLTLRPFAGWDGVTFDVTPRFECLQTAPNGTKVATFGYFNPNPRPVTVPLGNDNKFSLVPTDRRQPTTFLAGGRSNNFSIGYTGTAPSWQLNGISASVDTTKTCTNSFTVASIKDATLSATSPNASFGTATTLEVSGQKASVVSFDRKAALSARGAGRLIKSARLEVDLVSGSTAIDAYPMRQDWDEPSTTWTCAKDQDTAAATSRCHMVDRWQIARRSHTKDNPYNPDAGVQGTSSGSKVIFDVTEAVKRALSFESHLGTLGWMLQSRAGGSSVLSSREGSKPAKLVIDAVPFTDLDFAGQAPFSFAVDASLATSATLPTLDGQPRPLAVLKPASGTAIKFAQNELLVSTDDQAELNAIKARWAATEIGAPTVAIPGVPKGHVLRIDTTRADVATLVPNLREGVNTPAGLQQVSSTAALGLLAAAAAEHARGTLVGVNWLATGGAVDVEGVNNQSFQDGDPVNPSPFATETSSNSYDWDHFQLHGVNQAWDLLFFSKKLKPVINAAVVDGGFSSDFQDESHVTQFGCTGGACANLFECGSGPCPWHGVHTASAGFGEPNNLYGGAGPGAGVSELTLYFGAGDMASTLISVPGLVLAGADIMNFSNAVPVPFWAAFSTHPAEQVMWAARHVAGALTFAIAGNDATDVDRDICFFLLFGNVCPWEETTWFPCEGAGVACVGATNYGDKGRAVYSNYGDSVEYWATGTSIAGADPSRPGDGSKYHFESGTSVASPFMAGTAALTWAANPYQLHAGDVEDCLNTAKRGGPDGRFVNTYFATECGLGYPSNLAPIVEIVQPEEEDVAASLGFVQIEAKAGDFEDGPITTFGWSDENGQSLGTTFGGQPLLYAPPGPGLHKITVTVQDAGGKTGTDTVTFSATPAPPNLKILSPAADGDEVFLGLPVDLVGRITNFAGLGASPPYDTSNWVGYHENTILFDHLAGASTQATFNQVGNGRVTWSMTVDGQTGSATRSFKVISDGKLHVKITSPAKETQLWNGELYVSLTDGVPAALAAVSTSDASGSVSYNWTVTRVSVAGVASPVATFPGQSVTFTPTGFICGTTKINLHVTAISDLGETDHDDVQGTVYKECKPG